MFPGLGKITSLLMKPEGIKSLIVENAEPTISNAIELLKKKYGVEKSGVFSVLVTPHENTVIISLLEWNGNNPNVYGSSDIQELAELLPNNLLDVIKG